MHTGIINIFSKAFTCFIFRTSFSVWEITLILKSSGHSLAFGFLDKQIKTDTDNSLGIFPVVSILLNSFTSSSMWFSSMILTQFQMCDVTIGKGCQTNVTSCQKNRNFNGVINGLRFLPKNMSCPDIWVQTVKHWHANIARSDYSCVMTFPRLMTVTRSWIFLFSIIREVLKLLLIFIKNYTFRVNSL